MGELSAIKRVLKELIPRIKHHALSMRMKNLLCVRLDDIEIPRRFTIENKINTKAPNKKNTKSKKFKFHYLSLI